MDFLFSSKACFVFMGIFDLVLFLVDFHIQRDKRASVALSSAIARLTGHASVFGCSLRVMIDLLQIVNQTEQLPLPGDFFFRAQAESP